MRIDLGPGPQRYKQQVKSGDLGVARGTVDQSSAVGAARRSWHGIRNRICRGPFARVAKVPAHMLFRLRQWQDFRYAK